MSIRSMLAISTAIVIAAAVPAYAGSMKNSDSTTNKTTTDTTNKTNKTTTDKSMQKNKSTTGSGPGASEFAPGRDPGTASTNNPGRSNTPPPGQQMNDDRNTSSGTKR